MRGRGRKYCGEEGELKGRPPAKTHMVQQKAGESEAPEVNRSRVRVPRAK